MNVTLEAVSQAGRCAAWLEALAGDEARVRVVTSSGAVTLSSKLQLQLSSQGDDCQCPNPGTCGPHHPRH